MSNLKKLGVFVGLMLLLVFAGCSIGLKQVLPSDYYIREPASQACPICNRAAIVIVKQWCAPIRMQCDFGNSPNNHYWWALSNMLITTTEPCNVYGKK